MTDQQGLAPPEIERATVPRLDPDTAGVEITETGVAVSRLVGWVSVVAIPVAAGLLWALSPWWLLLIPAVLLLVWWLLRRGKARRRALRFSFARTKNVRGGTATGGRRGGSRPFGGGQRTRFGRAGSGSGRGSSGGLGKSGGGRVGRLGGLGKTRGGSGASGGSRGSGGGRGLSRFGRSGRGSHRSGGAPGHGGSSSGRSGRVFSRLGSGKGGGRLFGGGGMRSGSGRSGGLGSLGRGSRSSGGGSGSGLRSFFGKGSRGTGGGSLGSLGSRGRSGGTRSPGFGLRGSSSATGGRLRRATNKAHGFGGTGSRSGIRKTAARTWKISRRIQRRIAKQIGKLATQLKNQKPDAQASLGAAAPSGGGGEPKPLKPTEPESDDATREDRESGEEFGFDDGGFPVNYEPFGFDDGGFPVTPPGRSTPVAAPTMNGVDGYARAIDPSTAETKIRTATEAADTARQVAAYQQDNADSLRAQAQGLSEKEQMGGAAEQLLREAAACEETAQQHFGMAAAYESFADEVASAESGAGAA